MAKLARQGVIHVAKLAKLDLTSGEITKFARELSEVISYVGELSKVDTSGVEPTSQTTQIEGVLRKDEKDTEDSLTQKDALSGTEKVHNGYFMVPMILEERGEK